MAVKGSKRKKSPALVFREAVEDAEFLQWHKGLQAVPKNEGRGRVTTKDNSKLLGSANIDRDCKDARVFQSENRWDFAIGYDRETKVVVFFVEVHSAISSEVSCMERKWQWLRDFLQHEANVKLRTLPREYHWVASGKVDIPKHVPQYKLLARLKSQGLRGPSERLELS